MIQEDEIRALSRRLRKIRGQVEGIENMIYQKRYCVDILQQIGAAKGALDKVGMILLESHARTCAVEAIKDGNDERAITELMDVYKALRK